MIEGQIWIDKTTGTLKFFHDDKANELYSVTGYNAASGYTPVVGDLVGLDMNGKLIKITWPDSLRAVIGVISSADSTDRYLVSSVGKVNVPKSNIAGSAAKGDVLLMNISTDTASTGKQYAVDVPVSDITYQDIPVVGRVAAVEEAASGNATVELAMNFPASPVVNWSCNVVVGATATEVVVEPKLWTTTGRSYTKVSLMDSSNNEVIVDVTETTTGLKLTGKGWGNKTFKLVASTYFLPEEATV